MVVLFSDFIRPPVLLKSFVNFPVSVFLSVCLSACLSVCLGFFRVELLSFLPFYMTSSFNEYVKVTKPIFEENLLLHPKYGKWIISGLQINLRKLSLNKLIRFP